MTEPLKSEIFTFRTPPELAARLRAHADANPGSIGAHVRLAVERYLDGGDDLAARVERLEELVSPDVTCKICDTPLDYYWKCPTHG